MTDEQIHQRINQILRQKVAMGAGENYDYMDDVGAGGPPRTAVRYKAYYKRRNPDATAAQLKTAWEHRKKTMIPAKKKKPMIGPKKAPRKRKAMPKKCPKPVVVYVPAPAKKRAAKKKPMIGPKKARKPATRNSPLQKAYRDFSSKYLRAPYSLSFKEIGEMWQLVKSGYTEEDAYLGIRYNY